VCHLEAELFVALPTRHKPHKKGHNNDVQLRVEFACLTFSFSSGEFKLSSSGDLFSGLASAKRWAKLSRNSGSKSETRRTNCDWTSPITSCTFCMSFAKTFLQNSSASTVGEQFSEIEPEELVGWLGLGA